MEDEVGVGVSLVEWSVLGRPTVLLCSSVVLLCRRRCQWYRLSELTVSKDDDGVERRG